MISLFDFLTYHVYYKNKFFRGGYALTSRIKRILLLAVLALAIIFYGTFGKNTLLMSLEGEAVTLTGPDNTSYSVPYSLIRSMDLREAFDYGAPVNGGLKNHIRYGLWENEELGKYQLFASDKITPVILLRTSNGETLVFNYESEATTLEYYNSFPAFLLDQGYDLTTGSAA